MTGNQNPLASEGSIEAVQVNPLCRAGKICIDDCQQIVGQL